MRTHTLGGRRRRRPSRGEPPRRSVRRRRQQHKMTSKATEVAAEALVQAVSIRRRLRQLPHREAFVRAVEQAMKEDGPRDDATAALGRAVRRYRRLRPRNDADPILMVPLRSCPSPIFRHVSDDGTSVTGFDAATLHSYLRSSGHFVNPITRAPLRAPELRRLDRLVPEAPVRLAERAAQLARRRALELERQTMLDFLTTDLGNEVTGAMEHARLSTTYSRLVAIFHMRGPTADQLHGALFSLGMVCHRSLEEAYLHEHGRITRMAEDRSHLYDAEILQLLAVLLQRMYVHVQSSTSPQTVVDV